MHEVTTQADFNSLVLESDMPVLVDFYTTWCGPCRSLAPVLKQLSEDMHGKAEVVKVNVGEEATLAQKYNIGAVPTLIVFHDGKEVERMVGGQKLETLKGLLSPLCS